MTEFLINYGLFLLKVITFVVAIILTLLSIFAISSSGREKSKARLHIKNVNKYYEDLKNQLNQEILDGKFLKNLIKNQKKSQKEQKKLQKSNKESYRRKIFVLNFDGDIKASAVKNLSEEITAIITVATPKDEVLVKINSGGGVVHGYGLGAAQLDRIKMKRIPLTIAIDKIAASGGYMMACVGDTILASPFAIIGSIGVVAQIPNFHRYLDKHDIDIELLTAGKFKRTLTLLGKNTKEARQKAQEDIEDIHILFKNFIEQHRPSINIEQVSTGEYWHGTRALEKQLIDRLITSDDYLLHASNTADIYEIKYQTKKNWSEKISSAIQAGINNSIDKVIDKIIRSYYI